MNKRAFTIIELLVTVSIIAMLMAILVPALGRARESAQITQSQANLRNLTAACGSYGAAFNDRQPSVAADDLGLYGGTAAAYLAGTGACAAPLILGYGNTYPPTGAPDGLIGFWLPCPPLAGLPGNIVATYPFAFSDGGFGSWRLPNNKGFHDYVGGRYYDRVFWSPRDALALVKAEPGFESGDEFTMLTNEEDKIVNPTYCWSPAAMYSPDVFSSRKGFQHPNSMAAGYKCPTVGQCAFPDLKTRMLEHPWLQNKEGGEYNGNFSGQEPWYFNQGYNSAPATMFFDGHIGVVGVQTAMDSDAQVKDQSAGQGLVESGLWMRPTATMGGSWVTYQGYYSSLSYDDLVKTSYHVFTTDGILGRDFLSQ